MISKLEAISKVKRHLGKDAEGVSIECDHIDDEGNYIIQVYRIVRPTPNSKVTHTATLGWFKVDKNSKVNLIY